MTMRMDCESAREQIDAYALGALDSDESRALESHLATCAECTRILDQARETAASIGITFLLERGEPEAFRDSVG